MQVKFTLSILLIGGLTSFMKSQVPYGYNPKLIPFYKEEERVIPGKFTKVEGETNKFINQGEYHNTFLILNPDSSFIYCNSSVIELNLAVGKYSEKGNDIYFVWDSVKTAIAASDTGFYKKYFKSKPISFKIPLTKFIFNSPHTSFEKPHPLWWN